jgi:hypothetical protein
VDDALRQSAQGAAKSLGMLVVQVPDLQELDALFGGSFSRQAVDTVIRDLKLAANNKGIVVRSSVDTFTLLMPGVGAKDLMDLFVARAGDTYVLEFEVRREEMILLPNLMARRVGATESIAEAHATLCQDIVRSRACEQRHQDYLRRERESHSKPMSLLDHRGLSPRAARWPELPATIPVTLSAS